MGKLVLIRLYVCFPIVACVQHNGWIAVLIRYNESFDRNGQVLQNCLTSVIIVSALLRFLVFNKAPHFLD